MLLETTNTSSDISWENILKTETTSLKLIVISKLDKQTLGYTSTLRYIALLSDVGMCSILSNNKNISLLYATEQFDRDKRQTIKN